jgi:hypothetical protein
MPSPVRRPGARFARQANDASILSQTKSSDSTERSPQSGPAEGRSQGNLTVFVFFVALCSSLARSPSTSKRTAEVFFPILLARFAGKRRIGIRQAISPRVRAMEPRPFRVKPVFDQAAEMPAAAERQAYVDWVCAESPDCRHPQRHLRAGRALLRAVDGDDAVRRGTAEESQLRNIAIVLAWWREIAEQKRNARWRFAAKQGRYRPGMASALGLDAGEGRLMSVQRAPTPAGADQLLKGDES